MKRKIIWIAVIYALNVIGHEYNLKKQKEKEKEKEKEDANN